MLMRLKCMDTMVENYALTIVQTVYSTSRKIANFVNTPKIVWKYVFRVKTISKTQNNKISLISLSKFPYRPILSLKCLLLHHHPNFLLFINHSRFYSRNGKSSHFFAKVLLTQKNMSIYRVHQKKHSFTFHIILENLLIQWSWNFQWLVSLYFRESVQKI